MHNKLSKLCLPRQAGYAAYCPMRDNLLSAELLISLYNITPKKPFVNSFFVKKGAFYDFSTKNAFLST